MGIEFGSLPFGMRTVTLGSAALSFLQATFCNATRSKSCNRRRCVESRQTCRLVTCDQRYPDWNIRKQTKLPIFVRKHISYIHMIKNVIRFGMKQTEIVVMINISYFHV